MRWIVNYIRSLFCKHDWEYLGCVKNYDPYIDSQRPTHIIDRWRCKKCGYIMKSKV